ncbi:hypothetical protein ENBRE01_2990 [Enteropsectra breve]|nr:hypothetical protein ENBRE01_2990 [Enteropsectra breve]
MKTIVIKTKEEKMNLINYLINGAVPNTASQNKESLRNFKINSKKFRLLLGSSQLYILKEDVMLKFYCEYERLEKLYSIHKNIGHFKRDKILHEARKKIYSVSKDETTAVVEAFEDSQLKIRLNTRPENKVINAQKPGMHYQADLVDMRHYTDLNAGFCWILNIIDVNSKFLMSAASKSKSAIDI